MPKEFLVKGEKVTLYTISDLANALGRDTITIRKWELYGHIPRAAMRTKSGFRLYTKQEIEALVKIVKDENIQSGQSFAKTKLKVKVFAAWDKLRKDTGRNVVVEQVTGGVHA